MKDKDAEASGAKADPKAKMCPFHAKGSCKFGAKCFHSHSPKKDGARMKLYSKISRRNITSAFS